MTCSSAPKLAYGSAEQSSSTFVNYTCNAGYAMQGSPYIECLNGVWDMTDYPICLPSLEQYSNASMSYHADSNTTTDTSAEFSTWFVYGIMGSGGCLALALAAFCLLACCHICGCCPGPVVAVGGRYQYSDRRWYSVFSWCDFLVKGKVCRKLRNMNKSKTIGPASDILDVEDETNELEKEKDDQPQGDADSDSYAEKERDVSSSTSGYASSSPSCSPLPDDTVVINIEDDVDDSKTTNGKTKQSQRDSEPLLAAKKRVATEAQRAKPKTKQSPTNDNAELPNNEEPDSKAASTDKPSTNKTVKPKTKQIKKSKK